MHEIRFLSYYSHHLPATRNLCEMASVNSVIALTPLDLSHFRQGNAQQKAKFANDFCGSLKRHGFAKLVNHGLSDDSVKELYHWVITVQETTESQETNVKKNKQFFQLPSQAKVDIAHPGGPTPQRGWSHLGAENSAKLHRSGVNGGKEGQDETSAPDIDISDARVSSRTSLHVPTHTTVY